MTKFLLACILFSTLTIHCFGEPIKNTPAEYIGCYQEGEDDSLFIYTPGDYIPSELSPISCMIACGKNWLFAGIKHGKLCLCTSRQPAKYLNDAECSSPCPGTGNRTHSSCGGVNRISVYDVRKRIFDLKLHKQNDVTVYEDTEINAEVFHGEGAAFQFKTGDGATVYPESSTSPAVTYVYSQPGSFKVSVEAHNNISEPHIAEEIVEVTDPLVSDATISCSSSQVFGKDLECTGSFKRGSPLMTVFKFGDGISEEVIANVIYGSVGNKRTARGTHSPMNKRSTIIMPHAYFKYDSEVYAWEFETILQGDIYLQIFRPKCDSGKVYCEQKQMCVSESAACNTLHEWRCQADEFYCFKSERCIPLSGTCPSKKAQTNFNVDFSLIKQTKYTIKSLGHQFLKLQEPMIAKKGDVIGWTSKGGEISFTEDNNNNEFMYDSGKEDYLYSNSEPKNWYHMISAHFINPSQFLLRHNYTSHGAYYITSNHTTPQLVYVDIPIDKINIQCPPYKFSSQEFTINFDTHIGTNITYLFDFGNGSLISVKYYPVTHTYHVPGIYKIKVTAYNSVSKISDLCSVKIYDDIEGLAVTEAIKPVAVGSESHIKWCVTKGTNVSYHINFGDGSPNYMINPTFQYCNNIKHKYDREGYYSITINATNNIGSVKTTSAKALVEIPITSLAAFTNHFHLTGNVYIWLNDPIELSVLYTQGSNILCHYNFNDSDIVVETKNTTLKYFYKKIGTFRTSVTCFNSISQAQTIANGTIVVEEKESITGLKVITQGTVFGKKSFISARMEKGTLFICEWNLGDGTRITVDKSQFSDVLNHSYSMVGDYKVYITCKNPNGIANASSVQAVEKPISGFAIQCPNPHFLTVNKEHNFSIYTSEGSKLTYAVHFGDGNNQTFANSMLLEATIVKHQYKNPGHYNVTAYAWNLIDKKKDHCDDLMVAEYPVKDIFISTNSPLRFEPGEVLFYLVTHNDVPLPTNALLKWDFGNGHTYTVPLVPPKTDGIIRKYKYDIPGIYAGSVTIYNNVSSKNFPFTIDIQKIIPIKITGFHKNSSVFVPGFGSNRMYFPLEDSIKFNVTIQKKDKLYTFDFGDGTEPKSSISNSYERKYKTPGKFNVSVRVANLLGVFESHTEVYIQESIQDMKFNITPIALFGSSVQVNITAETYGTDTCAKIDFGDNCVYIVNRNNCRLVEFNQKKNFTFIQAKSDSPIQLEHFYNSSKGWHNVSVHVSNEVSVYFAISQLYVNYIPCPNPVATISDNSNQTFPKRLMRSFGFVLQSNVTLNCNKADNVTLWWKVFTVGNDTPIALPNNYGFHKLKMPFTRKPGTLDPTVLELPENTLPYGLLRIELNVAYESDRENLEGINSTDTAWFEITPSNLKASIIGGVRRAVGFDVNVPFDASRSYDPDNIQANRSIPFEYEWYCRRHDEEFPESFDTVQPDNDTAGCFKNGKFRLHEGVANLRHLKADGSQISIKTSLIKGAMYVMRVYVKKGERRGIFDQEFKILNGVPPSLEIQCSFNCYEKLSPTDPLKIQSLCSNCNSTTAVFYRWRMYLLNESTDANGARFDEEIEIKDLESKTTTSLTNANIALKGNVLEFSSNYILRVMARMMGSDPETGGFSDFRFTVNRPPSGGFCEVSPREGVTLSTIFAIKCDAWFDEDTPIKYKIDTLRGGERQNMYTGFEREVSMILPIGQEEDNYEYELIVTVEDHFAFGVSKNFKVKVTEPDSVDFDGVSNDLESLAAEGNLQVLSRLAFAAGSLMNKKNRKSKTTPDDAKQTREKLIRSMNKAKACSLSEIKQMGGVQAELTKSTDEVSEEAQKESSNALDAMSDCMLQASGVDPEMSSTAESMFLASSNVLNAETANKKNVSNATSKNNADKAMDTINKVGGALMRQLVAGDTPKTIRAGNMDIEMAQVGDNADEDETGFQIPEIKYILGNQSLIEVTGKRPSIGAMVTSTGNNPYQGAAGADDVKSDVMGLALSGPDGSPMDLSGQEMTMFVKRDLTNDIPPIKYKYDTEQGAMKVHRVNFTSNISYTAIEIRPIDPDTVIHVYISHERRPTVSNAVTNYTQVTLKAANQTLPDPFIWLFSTDDLNGTGKYYIGVKMTPSRKDIFAKYEYDPTMEYTLRTWETLCKIWDEEEKAFTTSGCRVAPKTTFNKTHCICKVGGENQEAPYQTPMFSPNATINTTSTTTTTAVPTTAAARTSRKKKITRATFAGGFFVMPNPIDFSKAFAGFANLAENPVAFATVLSILGAYLILLFWARREDRKDIERAGVTPLVENDPSDRQFYEITVYTGFTSSAATTANVFFQLSGDEDQTEVRRLKDENRKIFQKRGQDVFLASFPDTVGDLQYLRIWHDNTGKNPSWYLSRVMVHDLNADRKFLFLNDNAIAVEEGDGSLERLLAIAGPEDMKSFNHLFFSTTQKNITDSHIWFSVFIRPPKSRFTRVQRLSCCLTLLYCTMVTNAMFYRVGGEADPSTTIHIGPFAFSPSQIGIGIMTSLIIFPVNILIVGVFRSLGPKPTREEMAKKKAINWWWVYELFFCCPRKQKSEFIDIISTMKEKDDNLSRPVSRLGVLNQSNTVDEIGFKMETPAQEKQREEKKLKMKKQKKKLPYWMKYFAWTLLILTSFTSAFFVVLYGFEFGKEKSAQWISALFVSFFQDVCVSQPIKILGLALFIALIVKKPAADDEEEEGEANKKQIDEEYVGRDNQDVERKRPEKKDIIRFQPPSKEKIAALRSFRLKELKMYSLLRDLFIYLVFVVALCQVTYSHLDPQSYHVRKSMEDIFIHGDYGMHNTAKGKFPFTKIQDVNDIWTWLQKTVVRGLYASRWYNNDSHVPGFVGDHYSNLFGGSRLRQLRIKENTCKVHKDFKDMIPGCHDWYSWGKEDKGRYEPSWLPIKNESEHEPSKYYKSWEYQTSDQLDTYPFAGSITAYRGGGYVGDMGKDPKKSEALLSHLYQNKWLDEQTRAVFLEVTVYNAQVNLFAIMNFVVEFLPTNGVELFSSIKIARLYTFGGSTESFTLACQFFVMLFFAISVYREGKKIYRERKAYFKGFWNLLEFATIVLVISTIGVFFSRMMLVNRAVGKIEKHPGAFVSFNKVTQWDVLFSGLTSVIVLLSCIKSIRLLQYNKTISLLASTLKGCAKPLAAFFVVFFIFFIAFTTLAYLLFVPHLPDYKSYLTASESVMSLLLGGFSFGEIENAKPIFGRIWFVLIMLFGVMYIMNVFLSIIMETYAAVKDDLSMQSQESELVDFMISKFKHIIGKGDGGRKAIMERFDKEEQKQREDNFNAKKKKKRFDKKVSVPKRKKYYQFIDEEIEMKFAQLDDSLNDIWEGQCEEDGFGRATETRQGGGAYVNPSFEYQEIHDELLMKQDLRDELEKWM